MSEVSQPDYKFDLLTVVLQPYRSINAENCLFMLIGAFAPNVWTWVNMNITISMCIFFLFTNTCLQIISSNLEEYGKCPPKWNR